MPSPVPAPFEGKVVVRPAGGLLGAGHPTGVAGLVQHNLGHGGIAVGGPTTADEIEAHLAEILDVDRHTVPTSSAEEVMALVDQLTGRSAPTSVTD